MENTMKIHYVYFYNEDNERVFLHPNIVIGGDNRSVWTPNRINCPDCLRNDEFQKDLIHFEIGCDGDEIEWEEFYFKRNSNFISNMETIPVPVFIGEKDK